MRLANRTAVPFWVSLCLGLWIAGLPLMALAVDFKPPKRGVPGRREGGGTRDPMSCVRGSAARLTALLPQTNLGLTTAAYPRFFWFVPKTQAKFAEFTLFEADAALTDRTPIYKTTFSITGDAGVASLALPNQATIPALAVGKDYHWSVALVCNPNNRQADLRVDGWVQRIAPDASLTAQLAKADSLDRVLLYANSGLWFDTLTTLAEQRCAAPKDASLAASWTQLLRSVKLNAISEQPLVQSCGK